MIAHKTVESMHIRTATSEDIAVLSNPFATPLANKGTETGIALGVVYETIRDV